MDIFVTAIVAIVVAGVAMVSAIVRKKPIKKIAVYALFGLIIGLAMGYFLTPFIISFY